MAYKLLDQNGNKIIINGMNKGYIKVPYNYQGLDWYNVNTTSSRYDCPFYSDVKCIYINGNMFRPYNGTGHKFINEAYSATQITISGRRWNEGFDHYEIYLNNELVSSGVFPNEVNTDIYVINKEANTSVILSGEWDSTNSKYIYHITTNAIIPRENSYQWFNPLHTATINLTVGAGQDITTSQSFNELSIPSKSTLQSTIASKIGTSSIGINIKKIEIDLSTLYWYLSDSDDRYTPYFAWIDLTDYILDDSAGTQVKGIGIKKWGSSYYNVTSYSSLYGYRNGYAVGLYSFKNSSSSGSRYCTSSSSSTLPTFTIRVTYEY